MRLMIGQKTLSIIAAMALVAACETAPKESADTSGSGSATQTTSSAPASTATAAADTTASAVRPGSQEDLVLNVGDRVFFDFDKYDLKDEARETLKRQAAWLKANPTIVISVEGHCDERGTREYNLALGDRRATAVRNYLITLGVSANRVGTISYGKERPVALGHTEAAWSQNRRGVTVVN